jgi:hypothetical protein
LAFWHGSFALYLASLCHFSWFIKSQKSKPKSKSASSSDDNDPLAPYRKDADKQLPSVSEIAHLSAIIAQWHDLKNPYTLAYLANTSMDIWDACAEQRKRRADKLACAALWKAQQLEKEQLPHPTNLPVSFDVFLRFMMPKKRPEDRAKFHREYARQCLKNPTEAELAEFLSKQKQWQITQWNYDITANDFRRFMADYGSDNRRKRARAGALALKQRRQKHGQT